MSPQQIEVVEFDRQRAANRENAKLAYSFLAALDELKD